VSKQQKKKSKTGGHKARKNGRGGRNKRNHNHGYHRDPQALLKSSRESTLILEDYYDGDPTFVSVGLIVSRRGPAYFVRWMSGYCPPSTFWTEDQEPLEMGGVLPCIARREAKAAVIGDHVYFVWEQSDLAQGLIVAIELRENALVRADALGRRPQTLAANLDRLWVVSALDPPPKSGLIDRYLVAAHVNQIDVGILLNKVDLFMDETHIEELEDFLAPYQSLKIPIILLSAIEGDGISDLRQALRDERSVFVGHSGVGKTSLLNALIPGLNEAVTKVSEATGKGQHTTTTSTLYTLESGGEIIDSPGIRSFGLWDMPAEELKDHFAEFLEYAQQCYFHNCTHLHEPKCAVIDALDRDDIHIERYENYVRIYDDLLDESLD
jgi:ribosome biogenesis GTPase / thiamine phosphate phosphatase